MELFSWACDRDGSKKIINEPQNRTYIPALCQHYPGAVTYQFEYFDMECRDTLIPNVLGPSKWGLAE